MKPVGVVGVGTMGHFMAEKLLEKGFETHVYDVVPQAVAAMVAKGAIGAPTPHDLAVKCDVIIMSLPGPIQINAVIFGEHGLAEGIRSGTILVDTSTVDPESTRKIAAKLEPLGVDYLDCPILGRPSAIGRWMLPSGGKAEVIESVRDVLESFAANIIHVGDHGAGNAVKLLNQMMFTTINAITSEVMAIADHVGISKEIFYQTVANSSAATVSGLFKELGANILAEGFDKPTFSVNLLTKDTRLALQMAKDAHAPSLIAGTVQMFNEMAIANGYGQEDSSALFKTFSHQYLRSTAESN